MKVVINSRGIASNLNLSFEGITIHFSDVSESESISIVKDEDKFSIEVLALNEYLESVEESMEEVELNKEELSEELFLNLVFLRTAIAKELKLPPYVVFKDKTLKEMATKFPVTLEELSIIHGVGEAKLDKYGEKFIGAIKEFVVNTGNQV